MKYVSVLRERDCYSVENFHVQRMPQLVQNLLLFIQGDLFVRVTGIFNSTHDVQVVR